MSIAAALTPLQTASLIIALGLLVQGYAVWTLRSALSFSRLWPFLLGAVLGMPLGVAVLADANPAHVRAGIGILLALETTGRPGYTQSSRQPVLARPSS